ncbi:MAG: hypothetical protein IKT47_07565 [Oscillospiraceae bacterium]|nr:hypothetical protein [Oscillospiraceae bacterium]
MESFFTKMAGAVGVFMLLFYAVLIIAVVFGIVISIRRRRKEKATGEAEEAKKY